MWEKGAMHNLRRIVLKIILIIGAIKTTIIVALYSQRRRQNNVWINIVKKSPKIKVTRMKESVEETTDIPNKGADWAIKILDLGKL